MLTEDVISLALSFLQNMQISYTETELLDAELAVRSWSFISSDWFISSSIVSSHCGAG